MACTSPRTTKLLHQRGDFQGFGAIGRIAHQCGCLGGKTATTPLARCCFVDRLAGRFRTCHAPSTSQVVERARSLFAKPKRERRRRWSHAFSVAQNALRYSAASARWLDPKVAADLSRECGVHLFVSRIRG